MLMSETNEKSKRFCGARCRTKGGAPCRSYGMANGRCRMHGGALWKNEKHGRSTLRAKAERRKESAFLREMKQLSKSMNEGGDEKINV